MTATAAAFLVLGWTLLSVLSELVFPSDRRRARREAERAALRDARRRSRVRVEEEG